MRRAHLITPFGVGALSTMVNGVTVITASLDAWFHDINGNYVKAQDMEIQDWRLQNKITCLGVTTSSEKFGYWISKFSAQKCSQFKFRPSIEIPSME